MELRVCGSVGAGYRRRKRSNGPATGPPGGAYDSGMSLPEGVQLSTGPAAAATPAHGIAGQAGDTRERYLDRELSWLDFNARVLALAEDPALPLLERAKFCAIFSQNLDEFFQVRVSALKEQVLAGVRGSTPGGLDPAEQLRAIRARVEELVTRQAAVFTKDVVPGLEEAGVRFADWSELGPDDQDHLVRVFEDQIFPVLTPLAVDPAHPFPYISNLSLSLAVVVRNPSNLEERFARVKVPPLLPRFIALPDNERFVPLEQVIAAHLDALFPGMEILAHHPFRVTRDADIELADESEDLLAAMEVVLRQRSKFGLEIRLEVDVRNANLATFREEFPIRFEVFALKTSAANLFREEPVHHGMVDVLKKLSIDQVID